MTEQKTGTEEQDAATGAETSSGAERRDLSWHLDRIWTELKDITRQLENETRRGGRIARLRFEIRGLRQDLDAEAARLGKLVYEAQMAGGKRPALSRVEGYDVSIEKMAAIRGEIDAKEEEVAELRRNAETEPESN